MTALSLLLAAVIGFATHRASLCTVRAMAELLATRRAHILASFFKASLWAIVVSLPLAWLAPGSPLVAMHPLTTATLFAGFVFGAGAALNGGCSFSTLEHLVDGDLSYAATLAGFAAGVRLGVFPAPAALMGTLPEPETLGLAVFAVGAVWAVFEVARLVRTRPGGGLWTLARFDPYRLSTAALVLGVCAGALATLHGGWTHTSALRRFAATPLQFRLLGAVVLGMIVSAWERRAFRVVWAAPRHWARHAAGGVLMGIGAAGIPGGNGWLILRAIPSLSPHALPAYAAILAGVGAVLLLAPQRPRIECTGDICRPQYGAR